MSNNSQNLRENVNLGLLLLVLVLLPFLILIANVITIIFGFVLMFFSRYQELGLLIGSFGIVALVMSIRNLRHDESDTDEILKSMRAFGLHLASGTLAFCPFALYLRPQPGQTFEYGVFLAGGLATLALGAWFSIRVIVPAIDRLGMR